MRILVIDGTGTIGRAVVAALRREFPDVGWHTFADWARQQDW